MIEKKKKSAPPPVPTEREAQILADIFTNSLLRAGHPIIFHNVKTAVRELLTELHRPDLAALVDPL